MKYSYPLDVENALEAYERQPPYSGFYPVGSNQLWHGGIHFEVKGETSSPINQLHAMGDGNIIAYRMNLKETFHVKTRTSSGKKYGKLYGNNFVLVEHEHSMYGAEQKLKFYALYTPSCLLAGIHR